MKEELIPHIKIKIAISLTRLLEASKRFRPLNNKEEEIAKSYNKIALAAYIRKATVSDIFNAKSKTAPNTATLLLIIEGMGYNLGDFAKIYDSVTSIDIEDFEQSLE
jgi:DNA invertase Pin-like site-specific DNA recombinase